MKGKKRDYSLPKGVSSRQEQAKLAKKWKKGVLTEVTPVAEFEFLPNYEGFYKARSEGWDYERLKKLIEENPWGYDPHPIPPEILEKVPTTVVNDYQAKVKKTGVPQNVRFADIPNKVWAFYPDGRITDATRYGYEVGVDMGYENKPKDGIDDFTDKWIKENT